MTPELEARIQAMVKRSLATAPPLSEEQRQRIAAIFASSPKRVARRMGVAA